MTEAIDADVLAKLRAVVGEQGCISDPAALEPHVTEWRGLFRGATPLLVAPATTAEAAEVLSICNRYRVPVVPQGGNTGLAGGAIPGLSGGPDEVLLSASRLNRIRHLDADNFTLTAEAGCILADLQAAAAEQDLLFPLSLAAEGSCQIGGNISTNAGGTNVIRYGNTRDLVLGLEVVLPDGAVLDGLSGLRKDNTGYDLKQLFIGAEGTLGFVTAASLKLFPQPARTETVWLAVADPAAAVRVYSHMRRSLGDEMVACELMPRVAIDMVLAHVAGTRDPLDQPQPWNLLVEFACAGDGDAVVGSDRLVNVLEALLSSGLIADGSMATSESQRADFWRVRHAISEAQKQAGASIKHDISVPISRIAEFLELADQQVEAAVPGVRPVTFGHLGDGNLHYNLSQPVGMAPEAFLERWEALNEIVHSLAVGMDGSFSAEHGIGFLKRDELARLKSPVAMDVMRRIKSAIDPNGIMNPGKLLGP